MLPLGRQKYTSVGVWVAAEGSSQSPGGAANRDIMCIDLLWSHTKSAEESGGILYTV